MMTKIKSDKPSRSLGQLNQENILSTSQRWMTPLIKEKKINVINDIVFYNIFLTIMFNQENDKNHNTCLKISLR